MEVTRAEQAIVDHIAAHGPVTFAHFMEMALYSAPGSYYGSRGEGIGPGGDFFTSPEVHPAFGALLARQVEQTWVAMGRPSPFRIMEMGPGTGALARDILSYVRLHSPGFYQAIGYLMMERSHAMAALQRRCMAESLHEGVVSWVIAPSFDLGKRSITGCILSNELPDAFPVHRVVSLGGRLQELYVHAPGGRLAETVGPLSDPRLARYFGAVGVAPLEGAKVEVNLAALDWMVGVAGALDRGLALTVDYGYPAEELYSPRHPEGTLLCFYRHTVNSDPYARVGEQDITAHVDFSSLARVGEASGLQSYGLAFQREALLSLGMDSYLRQLSFLHLRRAELDANRLGMEELLKSRGLGRIRMLLQGRGMGGFQPASLGQGGDLSLQLGRDLAEEPPPLLTASHLRLNAPPPREGMLDEAGMWRDLMGEEGEGEEPRLPPGGLR